jgi:CRP-like cAMP-binding protein
VKYEPNSLLWEYNDPVSGVYIIITGEVKIFKPPKKEDLIRSKKSYKKNQFNENNNKSQNINFITNNYKILSERNKKFKKIPKKNDSLILSSRKSNLNYSSVNKVNSGKKLDKNNFLRSSSSLLIKPKVTSNKFKNHFKNNNINAINTNNNNDKDKRQKKEYANEISLTEKNFCYKEPLDGRIIDYIETFGQIIGEDCLIRNLNFYPYCAETLTKCYLGFISTKDYHLIFDRINAINKTNIISFLYHVNYFNNKNNFLHKLYRAIKIKLYKKGSYIFRQNDPFRTMFIIKNGNVDINVNKIEKIKSKINSDLVIGDNNIHSNKKIRNKYINRVKKAGEFERFTSERFFEIKGEYYENKEYTVVHYGVGEILGNIEYYSNIKKYIYSALCLTNVEIYEIDINLYKRIESPENFEFLNQKTLEQLSFFKKRMTEINLIHNKNIYDHYTSRNKFMKIFFERHPPTPSVENSKYINNGKEPFPITVKMKNKKLNNTKLSPISSFDVQTPVKNNGTNFSSINNNFSSDNDIHKKRTSFLNPFITNNKDYVKMFNSDSINYNTNNRYNFEINNDLNKSKRSIFNSSSKKKHNSEKKITLNYLISHKKDKNKNYLSKNEIEREETNKRRKLDYTKIIVTQSFSHFLCQSYLNPKCRAKDKEESIFNCNIHKVNTLFKNKYKINLGSSSKDVLSTNISSPKINNNNSINIVHKKAKRDIILNKASEIKNTDNKILSEENKDDKININSANKIKTTISFNGYRVFLPKKENNIIKRNNRKIKSFKLKNLNQNNINDNDMKNDIESKDDNKDNKDKRSHFFRNNKSKRKTTLCNPHKAIKLLYQEE